jgi:hypothetical protein
MAEYALRKEPLSRSGALIEIHRLLDWEERHGYAIDVTTAEIGEIARRYYSRSVRVLTGSSVTRDAILDELRMGNAVILPAAGRLLGNPYFRSPGPAYHMLVIRGYQPATFFSPERFITNDPGTRRGEEYIYDVDTLLRANHDWTGSGDTIVQGMRAILIVEDGG